MPGRGALKATEYPAYGAPGCKSTVIVVCLHGEVTVLIILLLQTLRIRKNRDKIGASDASTYYVK
jgi:hypothetical protein